MEEERWIAWEIQTSKRWSDMEDVLKYTDIDFIDYDHKMLVEYALKLNRVISQSESGFSLSLIKITKALLDDLYGYAGEHFRREEKFMELYALPNVDMHKREHKKILTMISEALDNFTSGKARLSGKLKAQVMDWLIKHINVVDYDFFAIANWSRNIMNASDWNHVKPIIRLTGINEIDSQHQRLTEIMLKAMKNIYNNPIDKVIDEELNNISAYALFHFDYEAGFMERYEIKEPQKHLQQHDYFLEKITQYAGEIKKDLKQLEEMKTWSLSWWIKHINSMDKDYFSYRNWAYRLIEQAEKPEDVIVVLRKTGIEEIDNDHMVVMNFTMNLNTLIKKSDQNSEKDLSDESIKEQVVAVLDKTSNYAAAHFIREEKIMEEQQMDDLRGHRAEHIEILQKLKDMKENYQSGRLYLSANIKTMILEWWIQHTNTTDYRTFVQNWQGKEAGQRLSQNLS